MKMMIDLDILRAVLKSFAARDPSLVAARDQTAVNLHRGLLIPEFADGGAYAPDAPHRQPLAWEYSVWSLTQAGQHLLHLSSNDRIWEKAKIAYTAADCSWSLPELYNYVLGESRS